MFYRKRNQCHPCAGRELWLTSKIFLISLLSLPLLSYAQTHNPISASDLSEMALFMAGDHMKGRANGSAEMQAAAAYIAWHFEQAGLEFPDGWDSFEQAYTFTGRRSRTIAERNVIGVLPGTDPDLKDEFILFSAHFDHVGTGREVDGDSIYNGANDNVAGTVTLIGLAHALKKLKVQSRRSIIFAAYSGEEMGLRGSRYFFENCPVDHNKLFVNLNFEMTGHCSILGKNTFYLTGPSFSNFDELIDDFNKTQIWNRTDTIAIADRLFFASDNAAIAVKRDGRDRSLYIPAFTLCTHGGEDHIHRPHDEPEFMNYENMARLVNYLARLTPYLASLDKETIKWDHDAFNSFMNSRR